MIKFTVDREKLVNAVAYLGQRSPGATKMKICKLLYFSDKEHLLQYGRPITGDTYVAMEYGPTPSTGLNMMRGKAMSRDTALFQSKVKVSGNEVRAIASPELKVFSRSDVRVMDQVVEKYGKLTAARLSAVSHAEPAWKSTAQNALIDFELMFEGRPDASLTLELLRSELDSRCNKVSSKGLKSSPATEKVALAKRTAGQEEAGHSRQERRTAVVKAKPLLAHI